MAIGEQERQRGRSSFASEDGVDTSHPHGQGTVTFGADSAAGNMSGRDEAETTSVSHRYWAVNFLVASPSRSTFQDMAKLEQEQRNHGARGEDHARLLSAFLQVDGLPSKLEAVSFSSEASPVGPELVLPH